MLLTGRPLWHGLRLEILAVLHSSTSERGAADNIKRSGTALCFFGLPMVARVSAGGFGGLKLIIALIDMSQLTSVQAQLSRMFKYVYTTNTDEIMRNGLKYSSKAAGWSRVEIGCGDGISGSGNSRRW